MEKTGKTNLFKIKNSATDFEEALFRVKGGKYVLRLYVGGLGPKSLQAIENIKRICEEYLQGNYQLEIIDIYKDLHFAKDDQIVAIPTLIKKLPLPIRKIIGSMTDTDKILNELDLKVKRN